MKRIKGRGQVSVCEFSSTIRKQILDPYGCVFLKKQQERRIEAGHLWVYSNEIDTAKSPLANFSAGELISLQSYNNKFLGIGYINPHSLISVRLLTRKQQEINSQFFINKIQDAFAKRKLIFPQPYYRLIYGEGDFLPGLIVDRFADILADLPDLISYICIKYNKIRDFPHNLWSLLFYYLYNFYLTNKI